MLALREVRQEAILLSLKKLDYATRNQLQRLHNLSGDRNARRVLNDLRQYVATFRFETGENVYYLSKAGRERVGAEKVRGKTMQAAHYIMRTDAYLFYAASDEWRNEVKISIPNVVSITPDAFFRFNQRRHFLEVDNMQHMAKNREKVDAYKKLKADGAVQNKLGHFPKLVWVTTTEVRRKQLLAWCDGLDVVVHIWDEIKK